MKVIHKRKSRQLDLLKAVVGEAETVCHVSPGLVVFFRTAQCSKSACWIPTPSSSTPGSPTEATSADFLNVGGAAAANRESLECGRLDKSWFWNPWILQHKILELEGAQ